MHDSIFILFKVMICFLLGWPCWILTNYKSSPKCPARQLSQISSVVSWEPKTIKKNLCFPRFPDCDPGNCTITIRWRDRVIDQIRSNMVAILNFKITIVKQFINRPICFLDPTNVGAAAKNIFLSCSVEDL